jgi:hypothetical protein
MKTAYIDVLKKKKEKFVLFLFNYATCLLIWGKEKKKKRIDIILSLLIHTK